MSLEEIISKYKSSLCKFLISVFSFTLLAGTNAFGQSSTQNSIESRYEEIVRQIISIQEKTLGIKFRGKEPAVKFEVLEGARHHFANYIIKENTIYLNPFFLDCNIYEIERNPLLENPQKNSYIELPRNVCDQEFIKKLLYHETLHHYFNTFLKTESSGNWLEVVSKKEKDVSLVDKLTAFMIWEGIVQYFLKPQYFQFDNNNWNAVWNSEKLEEKFRLFVYDGGYALVKPILDKGIEAGIRYLIEHPVMATRVDSMSVSFDKLPSYQENALKALSLGNSNKK